MIKYRIDGFLICLVNAVLLVACGETPILEVDEKLEYQIGKNSYQLESEGHLRNFHVFVPSTYDESTAVPLVFMFHGSGGNGNNVYETSGWKEVAEANGFIVVFPTALEYFVVELNKSQTKWSAGGLDTELEPGANVVDDIPFVNAMLSSLINSFTIDEARIYASGFSNGGGFTKSRIMCELSDIFAAVATSGGHGLPEFVPVQSNDLISLHTIMGNKDNKKLKLAAQTEAFPMDEQEIIRHDYLRPNIDNILNMLDLDSTFSSRAEQPYFNTMMFDEAQSNTNNEFIFRMVKDMGHIWPNGSNHPSGLNAAELFWTFFQRHNK